MLKRVIKGWVLMWAVIATMTTGATACPNAPIAAINGKTTTSTLKVWKGIPVVLSADCSYSPRFEQTCIYTYSWNCSVSPITGSMKNLFIAKIYCFENIGNELVTLTVTDGYGLTDSVNCNINVVDMQGATTQHLYVAVGGTGNGSQPNPLGTIQDAVEAASDGASTVIHLAAGTYSGSGNFNIAIGNKHIAVVGDAGAGLCIIDCGSVDGRRGFALGASDSVSLIKGVSVINGKANTTGKTCGGAIQGNLVTFTLSECVIRNNEASEKGGGLSVVESYPCLVNCLLTGNSADYGGGVFDQWSTPGLLNCTVAGNSAVNNGRGIGTYIGPNDPPYTYYRFRFFLANSVLWGNTGGGQELGGHVADIVYSDLAEEYPQCETGCIHADPCFVNASDPDGADNKYGTADDGLVLKYSSPYSPCIDTVAISTSAGTDITGRARVDNTAVTNGNGNDANYYADMGAYEALPLPLPSQAVRVSPPDQSGVAVTATLQWTAGAFATSHNVYFGTVQADVTNGTGGTNKGLQNSPYNPGTLNNGIDYYWRIDEVNSTGTTTGTVWHFKTLNIVVKVEGVNHTLFLMSDGTVQACGWNYCGQLGDNSITERWSPVQVLAGDQGGGTYLHDIIDIGVGDYHSMALDKNGHVWCWGSNVRAQCGTGVQGDYHTLPVQVMNSAGGYVSNIIVISAGAGHNLAIESQNPPYNTNTKTLAWGSNGYGELGIGTTSTYETKAKEVSNSDNKDFGKIEAGGWQNGGFSVAIDKNGFVWAWGRNNYGQLGNNISYASCGSNGYDSTTPIQVRYNTDVALSGVVSIAAGGVHALALKSDGTVVSWGRNDVGQLGAGSTSCFRKYANAVLKTGGSALGSVVSIAAGGGHSLASDNNGNCWAWGADDWGQLGIPGTANQAYAQKTYNSAGSGFLSNIARVFSGDDADISFALTTSGIPDVWGWGGNIHGSLGVGNTTQRDLPVSVDIP